MPSKLTGMLASARAIVATAHPGTDLATVVQTCGLVVPPEDAAAGYLYSQAHLDSEAVLGRFESDLREVVGV